MRRFAFVGGIFAAVMLALAAVLTAYRVTHPWTGLPVRLEAPFDVVARGLSNQWAPLFAIVGLGAAVAVLFALAVNWGRQHPR